MTLVWDGSSLNRAKRSGWFAKSNASVGSMRSVTQQREIGFVLNFRERWAKTIRLM